MAGPAAPNGAVASRSALSRAPEGASAEAIRRAEEVLRWRRRSLTIRFWRGFLPVMIGAVLLGLVIWVGIKSYQSYMAAPVEGGDIRMLHPQFSGRNAKNQPYSLTADSAVRDNRDINRIALSLPHFTMQTEAPAPVVADAANGLYNQTSHILQMSGAVKVTDGQGYTYQTEAAEVNTSTHDADGSAHVVGDGPMGHFEADSFRIDEKGDHAVLTGHVRSHLLTVQPPGAAPKVKARAKP